MSSEQASSDYGKFSGDYAVDGIQEYFYASTERQNQPYMIIDFEKIYLVYAVKIHVLPEAFIDNLDDILSDNSGLGMFIFRSISACG